MLGAISYAAWLVLLHNQWPQLSVSCLVTASIYLHHCHDWVCARFYHQRCLPSVINSYYFIAKVLSHYKEWMNEWKKVQSNIIIFICAVLVTTILWVFVYIIAACNTCTSKLREWRIEQTMSINWINCLIKIVLGETKKMRT